MNDNELLKLDLKNAKIAYYIDNVQLKEVRLKTWLKSNLSIGIAIKKITKQDKDNYSFIIELQGISLFNSNYTFIISNASKVIFKYITELYNFVWLYKDYQLHDKNYYKNIFIENGKQYYINYEDKYYPLYDTSTHNNKKTNNIKKLIKDIKNIIKKNDGYMCIYFDAFLGFNDDAIHTCVKNKEEDIISTFREWLRNPTIKTIDQLFFHLENIYPGSYQDKNGPIYVKYSKIRKFCFNDMGDPAYELEEYLYNELDVNPYIMKRIDKSGNENWTNATSPYYNTVIWTDDYEPSLDEEDTKDIKNYICKIEK